MCMACNNRRCARCGRRYGEHRASDDACPSASFAPDKMAHAKREYRKTTFQKRRSPGDADKEPTT